MQEELINYEEICVSLREQLVIANEDILEFTSSSKELQEELEKELIRMEKVEMEMRKVIEEVRDEANEWKLKYTSALKDHTNTITHMQKELEYLRSSEKSTRVQLRDIELDNDDLEKSEREKDSSLQDLESRYSKTIERIALLEQELVNKAQLEEEAQRLKDALRDGSEEIFMLREQVRTFSLVQTSNLNPLFEPILNFNSKQPAQHLDEMLGANFQQSTKLSLAAVQDSTSLSSTTSEPYFRTSFPMIPVATHSISIHPTPLSRSNKTLDLSSNIIETPREVREKRADGIIKEMKDMTDRVKQLTSRLDRRRSLVMAGSSIPRANTSPRVLSKSVDKLSGHTSIDLEQQVFSTHELWSNNNARYSTKESEIFRPNKISETSEILRSTHTSRLSSIRPLSRNMLNAGLDSRRPSSRSSHSATSSSMLPLYSHSHSRPITPSYKQPSTLPPLDSPRKGFDSDSHADQLKPSTSSITSNRQEEKEPTLRCSRAFNADPVGKERMKSRRTSVVKSKDFECK